MDADGRSLIILLLDPDGQRSPIYGAARRAGHRPVVATGIDTATIVLGSLVPDVVVVRSTTPDRDREWIARLAACAVDVPIRLVSTDGALADALRGADAPLN